jgi:hypothetical protein
VGEHSNNTGDLGWAVARPSNLLASGMAAATRTAAPISTRKSGSGRLDGRLGMLSELDWSWRLGWLLDLESIE